MHRKNRKRFFLSIVLSLAAVVFFAWSPASAKTIKIFHVTHCGQTLDKAGVYVLDTDLDCSGSLADGLVISASGVTFHLGNHTLSSTDCDMTREIYGIFVPGNIVNVKIDGGTVRGFVDGVVLSSSKSRVSAMTVTGACLFGIAVQNNGNTVTTSRVSHSGGDGIGLQVATQTLITANDISDNGGFGVGLANNSNHNFITYNMFSRNGANGGGGIVIQDGDNNNNNNNTVANNALDGNVQGIVVANALSVVHNNTIRGSLDTGLWMQIWGIPSIIMHNTVLGSAQSDMLDDSLNCGGNTWRNNFFDTDVVNAVSDGGMGVGCIQ
jgi:parallel beta helix pectate lyase-like protein